MINNKDIKTDIETHSSDSELWVLSDIMYPNVSDDVLDIIDNNKWRTGIYLDETKYYIDWYRITQRHIDSVKELLDFPEEYYFTKQYFKVEKSCLYNIYIQRQRELWIAPNIISEWGWDEIYNFLCGIIDKEIDTDEDKKRLKKIVSEVKKTWRWKSWNNSSTPRNYTKEENIRLFDIKWHIFKQKHLNVLLKLLEQPENYYFSKNSLNMDYNPLFQIFRSYYDNKWIKFWNRDWKNIVEVLNDFVFKLLEIGKIDEEKKIKLNYSLIHF